MHLRVHALLEVGRRGLGRIDAAVNRWFGPDQNPLYQSGAIVVALFVVLLVTGLYLLLFYRVGGPWASVDRITEQAWTGRWIRGLHRFGSDAAVLAVAVHAFRMLVQRRSWGPRALAWLTGVLLLGTTLVCGWTGYVMVWDTQAQVLAVEGARLLDVLPIFSEPISRAFVGEQPIPGAFFFLNLFAHVAIPVGLILLLWLHVSRVSRPVLAPPRPVLWTMLGLLMVLSVAWPIGMAPEADLFRVPRDVPLDLFYSFWIPLVEGAPAGVVWLLGLLATFVVATAPWWSRPLPAQGTPPKSVVNERVCTGCEQCMLDCPYTAISMIPRTDGREGIVARVNPALCVGCGICIGSCAPMALGPPGRSGRDQLGAAKAAMAARPAAPNEVVVIACRWGAPQALAGMPGVRVIEVSCAGNVHTSTIEFHTRSAAGVVVAACPVRDCQNREGGTWLEQRVHHGREAELKERVDRRGVRLLHAGVGEGALLRAQVEGFVREIATSARDVVDDAVDLIALCDRDEAESTRVESAP